MNFSVDHLTVCQHFFFADVARRHSAEATAVFVAEQDELLRGDLPRAFVEPIFALEAGQTSEVLEAEYGFHVFQVVEKRPSETQPLQRVREVVRRRLLAESADQQVQSFVAEAEGRYNVRVAERNLPFPIRSSKPRSPDP